MSQSTGPIQRQQLTEQVLDSLRGAISGGRYPIGAKLPPEPQLMAELGVGRSTLREAVRVLAHAGVLEVRQGDGTYVRAAAADAAPLALQLRRAKVHEVQEIRRALELETVRLAAERRTAEDLERLATHLAVREAALAAGEPEAALDADIAFHCAVAEASGNRLLTDLYRSFAHSLRTALAALWRVEGDSADSAALHQRLVDAIAAGEPEAAAAAADTLLDRHRAALALAGPADIAG